MPCLTAVCKHAVCVTVDHASKHAPPYLNVILPTCNLSALSQTELETRGTRGNKLCFRNKFIFMQMPLPPSVFFSRNLGRQTSRKCKLALLVSSFYDIFTFVMKSGLPAEGDRLHMWR